MRNREGVVTSLADIRFTNLRAEHDSLLGRVNDLMATAHQNAQRFQVITDLSLALIECEDLAQIDSVLNDHIIEKTEADDVALFVQDRWFHTRFENLIHIRFFKADGELSPQRIFGSERSYCQTCRSSEYEAIFGLKPNQGLASIAVIPVPGLDSSVALVIGSHEPEHFSVTSGTLFLDYVGDVFSRIARRVLHVDPV